MNDITKLADDWRKKAGEAHHAGMIAPPLLIANTCARELEAALPKWTEITDDPDTWPDRLKRVVFSFSSESHCWIAFMHKNPMEDGLVTCYWRPLCDLDYPPEQSNEN